MNIPPKTNAPQQCIMYIAYDYTYLPIMIWFQVTNQIHHQLTEYRSWLNTLRPRQNGRRFADDMFKRIFLNENIRISIKISLKFVPKGPINNNPALVQIMAWRRSGDKPLSEPMMVSLLTHIWVTRPQWVNVRPFLVDHGRWLSQWCCTHKELYQRSFVIS